MRKALNENPLVQVGVIAALIVLVAVVFMMNMGGGGGGGESASTAPTAQPATSPTSGASTAATGASTTGSSSTAAAATPVSTPTTPLGPEPPQAVSQAYERGDTLVLLFIREGGIEDRFVRRSVEALRGEPGVSVFIVPASEIASYSHLTQGLQVSRVPAMVVVSPKRLSGDQPVAQVHYGYRSDESVKQAVRDAEYEGQPASYIPE